MAPKKGLPPKGQRAITKFFVQSPSPSPLKSKAAPEPAADKPAGSAPPAKRQRLDEPPLGEQAAAPAPQRPPPRPPSDIVAPPGAKQALQAKLGLGAAAGEAAEEGAGPSSAAAAAGAAAARGTVKGAQQALIEPPYVTDPSLPFADKHRQKLTPLEQQVVELKRAHPGILLAVEVGYKFLFKGADAETAARELGIYAYQDRSFLTAGIPVHRLHWHVRRLVQAGHKVGIVRQTETAAIKKAGDNRSAPFERRMTALYTRSTLEAGELGGLLDDGEEEEEEGGAGEGASKGAKAAASAAAAAARRSRQLAWQREQPPTSYLVCCVEEPAGPGSGGRRGSAAGGSPAGGTQTQATQAAQGTQGTQLTQAAHGGVEIGLVAVEVSTGAVLYAQFRDGLMRSELESRLLFASPAELLLAQPLSPETRRLCEGIGQQLGRGQVRLETTPAAKYAAASGSSSSALSAVLSFYGAVPAGGGGEGSSKQAGAAAAAAAAPDAALAAVRGLPPLVLRALAHLLDYLRPFHLEGVLRLGASFQPWEGAQEMRLSANTLRQLEIFGNTADGGKKGSLLAVLDHTQTAMGRRLLRSWVGKPLRQAAQISARLDAVQELAEQGAAHPVLSRLSPALKKLGDLERAVTRAYHGTIKPSDFAATLQTFVGLHEQLGMRAELAPAGGTAEGDGVAGGGLGMAAEPAVGGGEEAEGGAEGEAGEGGAAEPAQRLRLEGVESPLLQQLLRAAGDLEVAAAARQLLGSMDLAAAAANDQLHLLKDSNHFPDVQKWRGEVAGAERSLADLLKTFKQQLQISTLKYMSLQNVGDYLLEVPTDLVKRVPKDWQKVNSVKRGVRFRPPQVKAELARLELAREHLQAACKAAWKQFLGAFAERYLPFRAAVQALAGLDCLLGLAALASSPGYCRPELAGEHEPPQLHITGGRHPVVELLLEETAGGARFVPNDTHLQGDGRRCMIITGPNMGGKSCYTRQCALIAIMAQLGSYVPAESARLRPLDGVYTRMGAADNLALGRSTFAEELGETSSILAAATDSSLVILDELGRGTSTGDGAAIAEACLAHVVAGRAAHPLTLFITHYPEVVFRLQAAFPQAVASFRMAHAEEEGPGDEEMASAPHAGGAAQPGQQAGTGGEEAEEGSEEAGGSSSAAQQQQPSQPAAPHPLGHIVFLFRLVEGVAPASYGLNVARMAQLPDSVLQRAAAVAARVQSESEERQRAAPANKGGGVASREVVQLAGEIKQLLRAAAEGGGLEGETAEIARRLQERARQAVAGGGSA